MKRQPTTPVLVALGILSACLHPVLTLAGDDIRVFSDTTGDQRLRRVDPGADGEVPAISALPDLVSVSLMGWQAFNPLTDPYTGLPIDADDAHLVRIDIVLSGILNPPGPTGAGGTLFDPFEFGAHPVFGFVEIDVDSDRDTGGEIGGAAINRYLANAGRFGERPNGSLGSRAARSGLGDDLDFNFNSAPYYERSGADFAIALCGCHPTTIVAQDGDGDSIFEAGETWIVRSRYFARAGGYQTASGVSGGSAFGLYDPYVNLRFHHHIAPSRTTISLVFPLDMAGAAMLTGQPEQAIDQIIATGGNHHSVREALADLVLGAEGQNGGPLSGPVSTLTHRWENRNAASYLDPTNWVVFGLVGTAYAEITESTIAWTDIGFDEVFGDLNGDGLSNGIDRSSAQSYVASYDGSAIDADGTLNGFVSIADFGPNFSVYDLDGDGVVGATDISMLPAPCEADWDDSSEINVADIFAFISDWLAGSADFDGSGTTNISDLFSFLSAWFSGCA